MTLSNSLPSTHFTQNPLPTAYVIPKDVTPEKVAIADGEDDGDDTLLGQHAPTLAGLIGASAIIILVIILGLEALPLSKFYMFIP